MQAAPSNGCVAALQQHAAGCTALAKALLVALRVVVQAILLACAVTAVNGQLAILARKAAVVQCCTANAAELPFQQLRADRAPLAKPLLVALRMVMTVRLCVRVVLASNGLLAGSTFEAGAVKCQAVHCDCCALNDLTTGCAAFPILLLEALWVAVAMVLLAALVAALNGLLTQDACEASSMHWLALNADILAFHKTLAGCAACAKGFLEALRVVW